MTTNTLLDAVFAAIDPEELAGLAIMLGNVPAPAGAEAPLAYVVRDWMLAQSLDAEIQPVAEQRLNVYARLHGHSGGPSLMFNSHLDSELVPELGGDASAWRDGAWVAGQTVVNDRGTMAAWLIAVRALRDVGVILKGDLLLTAVCGEIGQAPVDEYSGSRYLGEGLGSRALVAAGITADYALVAETTGFGITGTECGSAFLKIHVDGNYVYTPRLVRPANPAEHPNAIVRAAVLIPALERWALGWEQTQRRVYDDGTVVPRASVGAIRGGLPFKPDRTAAGCDLYMDVRLPPGDGPDTVVMEIEAIMEREGIPGQVTCYASHLGYVGDAQSPVARAAADAYRIVRGTDPPAVASPVCSMWRDTNIFHPAGIPSVTFGPPRQTTPADSSRPGRPCLLLDDLVDTARMYATVAMTICGVTDGEVLT